MVKKKTIVAMLMFVAWLMPAIAFADSYSSMWKQWSKMSGRDLPKSELAVLKKIVDKATAERAYGLCSFSNKRAVTHDACRLPAFS